MFQSRIWLDLFAVALALGLVLAVALRAVLLPVVSTLFGLLVAGSSFGVLEVLFGGSNPPLGGPGYLDPITTISVLATVLGVTTLFSTFLSECCSPPSPRPSTTSAT